MKSDVYTQKGTKKGSAELPERVFGAKWNPELVHQVVVSMQSNARNTVAHTKDRGEVSGGGKKPWKQKGTGRARHGSIRSPIWIGGGVTHGPRNERNFLKKINKKMRAGALYSVLSKKLEESELLFVDAVDFKAPKTTDAQAMLAALADIKGYEAMTVKKHNSVLIALPASDANTQRSFANINNADVCLTRNLNPVEALRYKYIVIVNPEESSAQLSDRMQKIEAK